MAIATVIAFSYAARVWIFDGVRSSTISTCSAGFRGHANVVRIVRGWRMHRQDHADESMMAVIVLAVPFVIQVT